MDLLLSSLLTAHFTRWPRICQALLIVRNENDTCRELVEPMLRLAGWESSPHSMTEQFRITKGRIVVAGRGEL